MFKRFISSMNPPLKKACKLKKKKKGERGLRLQVVIIEQVDQSVYKKRFCQTGFNEFILSYPRGAYTGMRTLHKDCVVEFESHLERLRHSLSTMHWKPYAPEEELFKDVEKIREGLVPMIREGLMEYRCLGQETKISVLISYCFETQQPLLAAHFSPLGPTQTTAKVQVSHRARKNPTVKDSKWVAQRSDLEAGKAADINEVLLVHEDQVYEGMASNFFAVRRVEGETVLVCAGLEHVLLGTIMKVVMGLCRREKIRILWEFPVLSEAKEWEGCFLTSTSRLVLPIETIYNEGERYKLDKHVYRV